MSLDRALVGRFFPLELDYMPLECEVQVLTKRCGILPADAENIASVAGTVRSLYGKQEISCTISTRETIAASMVANGADVIFQAAGGDGTDLPSALRGNPYRR